MLDPKQKLAALQSEQQLVANNYKEADTVLKNCEIIINKSNIHPKS